VRRGARPSSIRVTLDVDRAVRRTSWVIVAFIPLNVLIGFLRFSGVQDAEQPLAALTYFDLGGERNLPTWFTAALLLLSSLVSLAASQRLEASHHRRGFLVLGGVMAYLSLDEATVLHERTTEPLRDAFGLGGVLYWSWVLPAVLAVVVIGAVLIPFVRSLPASAALPIVVSGMIYVASALGLELAEGYFFDRSGGGVVTDVLSTIEEVGEMFGVLLYLRSAGLIAGSGLGALTGRRFPTFVSMGRSAGD